MAGFEITKNGCGLVVYKPIGYKKYQLCTKDRKGMKHIAVLKDDAFADELKKALIALGVEEI